MNINEVEKILSVSRANIRFYEKEGLISPKRKENNYRDYSEEDIAALKKIIVFRKLGFSIEEIAGLQGGELTLSDAVKDNIHRLEETIDDLRGALEISKKMASEQRSFPEVDQDRYWDEIHSAEQAGASFIDICKDYLLFELDLFDTVWKSSFLHNFKGYRKKYGVPAACAILLLVCIIRGLSRQFLWNGSFWEGFSYPFVVFAIVSLIFLPIYILRKKSPKSADVLEKIVAYVCAAFLLIVAVAFIVLLLNQIFHFWF